MLHIVSFNVPVTYNASYFVLNCKCKAVIAINFVDCFCCALEYSCTCVRESYISKCSACNQCPNEHCA